MSRQKRNPIACHTFEPKVRQPNNKQKMKDFLEEKNCKVRKRCNPCPILTIRYQTVLQKLK